MLLDVWSRPAAGNPSPPMVSPHTPPCWWPGHIPPSMCYTYTLASCYLYTIHIYPHDTSMPCSRFTAYMPIQPIQSIYNLLLPIQYFYSSHVEAYAIHTY